MKPFDCAAMARRLHAFHDGELPVSEQIAVSAHLTWCADCAAHSADLRLLRNALQALLAFACIHEQAKRRRLKSAEPQSTRFNKEEEFALDEVLQLVAAGLGNKQIAVRMDISEHPVKFHVASILGKLGADSRTEAVALRIRRGLVMI